VPPAPPRPAPRLARTLHPSHRPERGTCLVVRAPPPPSLPYKVDTSRPSLRTKWTRPAHSLAARGGVGHPGWTAPRTTCAAPARRRMPAHEAVVSARKAQ